MANDHLAPESDLAEQRQPAGRSVSRELTQDADRVEPIDDDGFEDERG